MDAHQIVLFFIFILLSTLISQKVENKTNIPSVLTLLGISSISFMFIHIANVDFSILMTIFIPLLLITDSLLLSIKELKQKYKSITYIAFLAVIYSVIAGTFIMAAISPYPIMLFLVVFTIIMATDAISVSAVFSKFTQVPHSVKFLAESESLFNDATAVIIFSLVTIPLVLGASLSAIAVGLGASKIIILSTLIGIVIGAVYSYVMSFFDDALDEFMFIPLTAYSAFYIAEMYHVSGILAVVSSILVFKDIIMKNLEHFSGEVKTGVPSRLDILKMKKRIITTKERLLDNEKLISQLAFLATAVLFVSLGSIISFKEIVDNISVILAVFAITTVVRYSTFVPMVLTKTINWKDSVILLLGGIKGGLAVLLVHMIPNSFEYKHLVEVVVFGQILLSTFVYVPIMMYLIPKFYTKTEEAH